MHRTPTCLFSLVLVLAVLAAGTAEAAGPGLVAHYRLDEGSGTIAYDSSGNGYNGTLLGQPQWTTGPGDKGAALAFNPNNACTGVECPTFDPTDGTGQFSLTIWAFWDGDETFHHFFTKSDGWGPDTMMFQIELWGGHTDATYSNKIGISYAPNSTPFYDMPKNEWTHLAFVYDGAQMVVYLNGVDGMGPKPVAIGTATTARAVIGVADNAQRVWTGALSDVQIYNRPLAESEVAAIMEGDTELSSGPQPEDGATDVSPDTTLSWTAGEFASTHDVYLGTAFDDVNEASRADPRDTLVSQGQAGMDYDPEGLLALEQTYYWRVDEVNAAPDNTIYQGAVWTFTTEPVAYPVTEIVATTNAISDAGSGPERTVDGSGLNATDQHSTEATDMWLATPAGGESVWIQYELDRVYKLHEMRVWNYNSQFELLLGFGIKDATVEYSVDGVDWMSLGDVELARGTATDSYAANTVVDLGGVAARYVRLTVNNGWGTMGAQYGLSEVRFFYIPVQAREPQPADGQTEVDLDPVLSWRAGRGAVSHQVGFSADAEALAAGTAPVETVGESIFTPDGLDFGTTYYWKVDEAGATDGSDLWEGDIWSFSTQEFVTIDDFESYDNADHRIYDTWIDGWVNETGSTVGYLEEPFAEQTIVHGGRQSMPLEYSNATGPYYSEAERDMSTADWSIGAATTLRLYVQGSAANDLGTLYVALEDSAGHVAVVTHPDPAVLTTDTWQEWMIPFDDFVGVNPAAIRTIYIGVGDRDNPTAGGTGVVFIDDVQFGRPMAN